MKVKCAHDANPATCWQCQVLREWLNSPQDPLGLAMANATSTAVGLRQCVGEGNEYYITLAQLEYLLMGLRDLQRNKLIREREK